MNLFTRDSPFFNLVPGNMKNLLAFFFSILLASPFYLSAQPQFTTGLDLEDPGYEQIEELQTEGSKMVLPPEASVYDYCPTPRNQGKIQSCVGWAVGYSALSIEKAIQYNLRDKRKISEYAFSALYLYNQIRDGDCNREGSRITDAIELLAEKGNVLASQFDENIEDCGRRSTPELDQYAQRFKISDYLRLFPVEENARQKVFKVKYALAKKKPVIIGLKIRKNFFFLNSKAQYWWPDIGDKTPAGGHAMTVVAYDDKRGAFLLMNSWGRNWGLGGFMWVKYNVFGEYCKYAFIIQAEDSLEDFWLESQEEVAANAAREVSREVVRPNTTRPTPNNTPARSPLRKMAGNFSFNFNPEVNQYSPVFYPAPVEANGFFYRTARQDWEVGQQFQLNVNSLEKQTYIYVFSVNNDGGIQIHWPRKESFNPAFRAQNASALQLDGNSSITIPGVNKALKITSNGRDHLVILFAKKPLRNLAALLSQVEGKRPQLPERLIRALGPQMIPLADIEFAKDEIGFEVNTRSKGTVVPLILQVNSLGK